MKRIWFTIIIGLVGTLILLSLGIWQVQRLAWKQGILSQIDARISQSPIQIPKNQTAQKDKYQSVEATGYLGQKMIKVLASRKHIGAGYRIIMPLHLDNRVVMVDLGFVAVDEELENISGTTTTIIGNLHWPDEIDAFTPQPDLDAGLWFARDTAQMAQFLGTEPVLIIARNSSVDIGPITPLPIDSGDIPNDHLQYALTWFSLAFIWAGMSGFFLKQTRKTKART